MPTWHARVYKTVGRYDLVVEADTEEEANEKLAKQISDRDNLSGLIMPEVEYVSILTEERSRSVLDIITKIKEEKK